MIGHLVFFYFLINNVTVRDPSIRRREFRFQPSSTGHGSEDG